MKDYDKESLKHRAQRALRYRYGFAPTLKQIVILEIGDNYIMVRVGCNQYQIYGYNIFTVYEYETE